MTGSAPRWLKLAALALAVSPAAACRADAAAEQTSPAPAALVSRVVDAADVIAADQERALATRLRALERDTKVQFVVVSTPGLGGQDIKDYTTSLGNEWKLGDKARHDGLLLVVAPNERRVRIGTGLGLEKQLTDAECTAIVEQMLPYYRRGEIEEGTLFGARLLDQAVRSKLGRAA